MQGLVVKKTSKEAPFGMAFAFDVDACGSGASSKILKCRTMIVLFPSTLFLADVIDSGT